VILILEVTSPQTPGASRHSFREEGGTIGRENDNAWVLPHSKVSGLHAVISHHNAVYYIEDRSRNGVYLNSSQSIKFINMIVHDMPGQGMGLWAENTDAEVYGCLVYYNGTNHWDHGIYLQNNVWGTPAQCLEKLEKIKEFLLGNLPPYEGAPEYPAPTGGKQIAVQVFAQGQEGDWSNTAVMPNDGLAVLSYPKDFKGESYVEVRGLDGSLVDSGTITVK